MQLVQLPHLRRRQHLVLLQWGHDEAGDVSMAWAGGRAAAASERLAAAAAHNQQNANMQEALACSADRKRVGSVLSCFSRGVLSQWLRTRKLQGLRLGPNIRAKQAWGCMYAGGLGSSGLSTEPGWQLTRAGGAAMGVRRGQLPQRLAGHVEDESCRHALCRQVKSTMHLG